MSEKRLTWYRWEWRDPFQKNYWTAGTASVYAPTYERPFVSILISLANGGGRVLLRCATLDEAKSKVGIPQEGLERLELAVTKAHGILEGIKRDLQIIYNAKNLPEGAQLVNTSTGEVLAEAERIMNHGG